jgi:hypothetical protein
MDGGHGEMGRRPSGGGMGGGPPGGMDGGPPGGMGGGHGGKMPKPPESLEWWVRVKLAKRR